MAVTKTHPIKSTLKAAIDYICNPEKTDGKLLVSSYGCAAETADIEFSWTRHHAIDKGTNLGRHLIQAFQPREVTPEQAHEIGMELAKEILGGKYEFVLTTHIDKNHVHNHLIFNAVSFVDHKRYHSNKRSYHDTAHAEIKRIESRSAELALVMKHAGTYRQLKPLYDRYRKSNDKEKFLRGHESKIILFEAAARELKRLGAVPMPTTESMKTELANLNAEKERLLAEYKAARTEAQEYDTVKQNVDALLTVPKEQEQQRRHELE